MKRKALLVFFAVGGVSISLFWLVTRSHEPESGSREAAVEGRSGHDHEKTVADTAEPGSLEERSAPEAARVVILAQDRASVLESRRMYMAHAPLREPSVDDPDSVENKRIMQQMIGSVLTRKTPTSPGTN